MTSREASFLRALLPPPPPGPVVDRSGTCSRESKNLGRPPKTFKNYQKLLIQKFIKTFDSAACGSGVSPRSNAMMLLSSPAVLAPVRAVASRRSRARAVHRTCAAADDSVRASACAGQPGPWADARRTQASEREKIYIGKGRVVSDDPKKYPVRAALGVVRCAAQVARASRAVVRPAQRRRRCQRHSGHLLWRAERATRARHARVVSRAATTQGRDAGGLVGGWAGGEKELKDWAAVPFSPIDPALRKAMNDFSDKKEVSCTTTPTVCLSLTARLCAP